MALDPSIFGLIGRGVKSVGEYDREALDLENSKTAGEQNRLALTLGRQKADEYTRGVEEQNALRRALSGATTTEDRIERARRTGTGAGFALAANEEKGLLERQKTASQMAKDAAEAKAKDYETGRKRYEHRIAGLSQFQDEEGARQWLADSVVKGDLGMDEATRMIQKIPAGDPAAFAQWKNNTIFSLQDAAKQAGYIKPDANATLSAQTSTANNAATNTRVAQANAETARHNAAMEAVAKTRAAKEPKGSDVQIVEGPEGFEAVDKLTGLSTPVRRESTGTPVMGKRAEASAKSARDASDVEKLLNDAEKAVPGATGSGIGAAVDAGAALFGGTPAGAKEIGRLRTIEGSLLAKMPRMEGPQSDKDVSLYRQAAGQLGDPTVPNAIKLEAIKSIREIQSRYKERGPARMPAQSQLGASSRVGGQAPRPAAPSAAPPAGPTVSNW